MIFVVVGTQEPFDRLVRIIDEWSAIKKVDDIVAQIARTDYKPRNLKWFDYIPIAEFDELFKKADLIVSHAGMGTIISALQYSKPIIVMPRLARLREHRNDHQLATANSFAQLGLVNAAYEKEELFNLLNNRFQLSPAPPITQDASVSLLSTIENFLIKNNV